MSFRLKAVLVLDCCYNTLHPEHFLTSFWIQSFVTTLNSSCYLFTQLVKHFLSNLPERLASEAGPGLSPTEQLSKHDTAQDNVGYYMMSDFIWTPWLTKKTRMTSHYQRIHYILWTVISYGYPPTIIYWSNMKLYIIYIPWQTNIARMTCH